MAKKKLEGIIWPNLPNDTYYLDAEKVEYDNTENYPDGSVGKALNEKANADGYYSNLTAGSAEQLLSTVTIEDEVPYLFRTSGGSIEIGDRETDCLVGGSVAFNQLVQNGNFESTTGWNTVNGTISASGNVLTLTATGEATQFYKNISTINNHVYFTTITANHSESGKSIRLVAPNGNKEVSSVANTNLVINVVSKANSVSLEFNARAAATVGQTIKYTNAMLFDLTQMFGSTIADYIYSLETATAGAGVAWFRKLFPKPYYAYNTGELKSVSGLVSHDMTGFNQWDEEWEVGGIDPTTGANVGSSEIRSKNYIEVLPNTAYYCHVGSSAGQMYNIKSRFYDADKNYIGTGGTWKYNGTFTIPSGAQYLRFAMQPEYGTTYKNDICINLAWDNSRNGEYEPYELHSYSLDSDLTLRGIPKLDANNNLYYDGDTYESDGTVTRRYGIVDLGTLTWTEYGSTETVTQYVTGGLDSVIKENGSARTTRFVYSATLVPWTWRVGSGNGKVVLRTSKDAYESASAFKTAMSGVYFVYELATPTTETADPYQSTQIVNDFGTEEYVSTSIVPVGHKTQYMPNLRAKLEMAPNSPNGNGDYIVRQTNGMNEYVPLVIEDTLPTTPSTAGSYKLTVTVVEGSDPVLSWEAE